MILSQAHMVERCYPLFASQKGQTELGLSWKYCQKPSCGQYYWLHSLLPYQCGYCKIWTDEHCTKIRFFRRYTQNHHLIRRLNVGCIVAVPCHFITHCLSLDLHANKHISIIHPPQYFLPPPFISYHRVGNLRSIVVLTRRRMLFCWFTHNKMFKLYKLCISWDHSFCFTMICVF